MRVGWLWSLLMIGDEGSPRDLAALAVPAAGALRETGDRWEPYRLVNAAGEPVEAVSEFFGDLLAAGRSPATLRSYGMICCGGSFLGRFRSRGPGRPRAAASEFSRWMLVAARPSVRTGASPRGRRGEFPAGSLRAVGAGALRDGAAQLL